MIDFSKYDPQVRNWMDKLVSTLDDEIGDIPSSYEVSLELLADAFETYLQAKNEIKTRGILVDGRNGDRVKNPAISVLNASQLYISKLLGNFALTRMSKSKLKENNDAMTASELLDALTND